MSMDSIEWRVRSLHFWSRHKSLWTFCALIWLLARVARLTGWMLRAGWHHPAAASVVLATLWMQLRFGWLTALGVALAAAAAAVAVRIVRLRGGASRAEHSALTSKPSHLVKSLWRRWLLRRAWAGAAANVKLLYTGSQTPPRLARWIWHTPTRASAAVRLVGTGRTADQFTADQLAVMASELQIRAVNVEPIRGRPGLARFVFHWGSRLDTVLPLEELPDPQPGWAMFGIGEDDRPAGLLMKVSSLIVGESRAGKSSTVWAMVCSAIEQSRMPGGEPVQFWVIDQSQTEFAAIQPLAARYARGQDQAIGLLRALWEEAARRAKVMGDDAVRALQPTADMPRIVLIVDEMLFLVSKKLEPKAGRVAEGLLFMLLTQAAKYGIVVWCGTQAGKVNVVGDNRDFFQQRLCHSVPSRPTTDCALGDQAASRGAECHKLTIPFDAGIGWIRDYDRSGYRKFRSVWVPDEDVAVIGRGDLPRRLLAARGGVPVGQAEPGHVYVMWGEEGPDGRRECLYVGQTSEPDPRDRWRTHLSGGRAKAWAEEVAMVQVEDCGTWDAAQATERQLIHRLRPRYNVIRYSTERVDQ